MSQIEIRPRCESTRDPITPVGPAHEQLPVEPAERPCLFGEPRGIAPLGGRNRSSAGGWPIERLGLGRLYPMFALLPGQRLARQPA